MFKIILVISLSANINIYSQSNLPSLYVGEITPLDRESSNYSQRIRNQIVNSIVKYQKIKYNILDDELIKQLSDKLAKLQKQGCDDTECMRALDLAINWDEKIVGEIRKDGEKFALTLKVYEMNKDTYQPRVRGSVYEKFFSFQLDFYINEMSKDLIDPDYTPNYAYAPSTQEEADKGLNPPFQFGRSFWGNIVFPGYNRIYNNDNKGYLLGGVWIASLIGIGASYSKYSSARESNSTWTEYTLTMPLILPQGSEYLGGFYAVNQMSNSYKEAKTQGQVINGLGGLALVIWSYSWFYKQEYSSAELWKIPNSEWLLDIKISRNTDKSYNQIPENSYVLHLGRSF